MPAAVAWVLAGGGIGTAAAVAAAGIANVIAFQAVSMVVMSAVSRKLTDRKQKDQRITSAEREVTVKAADGHETFVYGKAWTAGMTVYHNAINHPESTYDTPNYDMFHVVRWACHRVSSLQQFRLDDELIDPSVSSITWDPVTYTGSGVMEDGPFRGSSLALSPTAFRWYLGNQTSADAAMVYFFDEWGDAHVGRDRAYGVLHITQINRENNTDNVFSRKGFPQNIWAHVHGKSVYDPRKNALNADPTFLNIASNWNGISQNSGDIVYQTNANCWSTVQGVGGYGGALDRAVAVTNPPSSQRILIGQPFNVSPLQRYSLRVAVRQPSLPVGSGTAYLGISFWDGIGRNIPVGSSDAAGFTIGTFHYFAFVNTNFPANWTEVSIQIGSGNGYTLPTGAAFGRLVVWGNYTSANSTVQQVQDFAIWSDVVSRHIVDVESTWQWADNPALCLADYLRNETFGFGKESRLRVNPSRFCKNLDPSWRRIGTLSVTSFWNTSTASGAGGPIGSAGASLTMVTGAPAGRTTLVLTASASSPAVPYQVASQRFPVDPTGNYYITLRARQDGTKGAYFGADFLTAQGAVISGIAIQPIQQISAEWSKYSMAIGSGTGNVIPQSARLLSLFVYAPSSVSGTNGATTAYYQDFRCMVGTVDKFFVEPWEQIIWKSVSSAAAYNDHIVTTPSGAQARFTCNGVGNTGQAYRDVIRDIAQAGNLRVVYSQSGWNFYGGWSQPAFELNRSDIKGALEVRGAADTKDRYNSIRGSFYDRHEFGKRVPMATVTVNEYRARDNSMQLFEDIDLPFTNDWWVAQRIAFAMLDQGDNQLIARIPVGMRGFGLAVGQHIAVRNDVMSWSPKYFMATAAEYVPRPGKRQGVLLSAREDYQLSYIDPGLSEYVPRSLGLVTSMSPNVPMINSATATPRIEAVELRWVNPAQRAFEWVDIHRNTVNSFGGASLLASVRADYFVDTQRASDQVTQFYWWRTRDFDGNVSSVYPNVNSGLTATGVYASPRDPEYAFFDEFDYTNQAQFEERWQRMYNIGAVVSFPQSGVVGGKALQIGSDEGWYISRYRVPFDPEQLYRMTARSMMVSSNAARGVFFGVAGFKADGTLVDVRSLPTFAPDQHWFAAYSVNPTTTGLWNDYTGHLRGTTTWPESGTIRSNLSFDPLQAAKAHQLVRYISPAFGVNRNATLGGGSHLIDYISLTKADIYNGLVKDVNITMGGSQWLTSNAGSKLGTYVSVAIASEYNVIALPNSPQIRGWERLDTGFHSVMPNSFAFAWHARVFISSFGGAPPTIRSVLAMHTRANTLVGIWAAVVQNNTPGLNNFQFGRWHDLYHETWANITSSDLSQSPTPYYITLGIELFDATNCRSLYLGYLNGRLL